jgi:hypothetical protein
MHQQKGYGMNTNFSNLFYTLTFASLGVSAVTTKFFSDYSNSMATPFTIATVVLGIVSVVTLIGELRKAESDSNSRELDSRFDAIWQSIGYHRQEIDRALEDDRCNFHNRMDREVETLRNYVSDSLKKGSL